MPLYATGYLQHGTLSWRIQLKISLKGSIVKSESLSESDSKEDIPLCRFVSNTFTSTGTDFDGSDDDIPLGRLVEQESSSLFDEEQMHLFYLGSEENFDGLCNRK